MIVTFYSFKGGVGRSMALANVAELLAQWGYRVTVCDWDLEAPGLERYMEREEERIAELVTKPGVVDLITEYKDSLSHPMAPAPDESSQTLPEGFQKIGDCILRRPRSWAVQLKRPPATQQDPNVPRWLGPLFLLSAGRRDGEWKARYDRAVTAMDWSEFYEKWAGGSYLEFLRKDLDANPEVDIVLIDSRTGVTELGGICTHHLADLVLIFTAANDQNLEGTERMVASLQRPQVLQYREGRRLGVLPIASRIDTRSAVPEVLDFKKKFNKAFAEVVAKEVRPESQFFELSLIPYVGLYSYEETSIARQPLEDRHADLNKPYTAIAEALVEWGTAHTGLRRVEARPGSAARIALDLLAAERSLVRSEAPRGKYRLACFAADAEEATRAAALIRALEQVGMSVTSEVLPARDGGSAPLAEQRLANARSSMGGYLLLVPENPDAAWLEAEANAILAQWAILPDFRPLVLNRGRLFGTNSQIARLPSITAKHDISLEILTETILSALASDRTVLPEPVEEPVLDRLHSPDEAHSRFLLGRNDALSLVLMEAEKALNRGNSTLAVFGDWGSGKSGLMRAGVVPAVRRGLLGNERGQWPQRVAYIQLEQDPAWELLSAVAKLAQMPLVKDDPRYRQELLRWLERDSRETVLVIDNANRLTRAASPDQRSAFFGVMEELRAATHGRLFSIVCERKTEWASIQQAWPGWGDVRTCELPGLSKEGIGDILSGGAKLFGLTWEPDALDRAVSEAVKFEATPRIAGKLLRSALEHREGTTITFKGYVQLGGVEQVIANDAAKTLSRLRDDTLKAAKQTILRLVPTQNWAERTLLLDDLFAPTSDFPVPPPQLLERGVLRLDHKKRLGVTLRTPRLVETEPVRTWVREALPDVIGTASLEQAVDEWENADRAKSAVAREPALSRFLRVVPLLPREKEFLAESQQVKKMNKTIRSLLIAALVLSVGTLVIYSSKQISKLQHRVETAEAEQVRLKEDAKNTAAIAQRLESEKAVVEQEKKALQERLNDLLNSKPAAEVPPQLPVKSAPTKEATWYALLSSYDLSKREQKGMAESDFAAFSAAARTLGLSEDVRLYSYETEAGPRLYVTLGVPQPKKEAAENLAREAAAKGLWQAAGKQEAGKPLPEPIEELRLVATATAADPDEPPTDPEPLPDEKGRVYIITKNPYVLTHQNAVKRRFREAKYGVRAIYYLAEPIPKLPSEVRYYYPEAKSRAGELQQEVARITGAPVTPQPRDSSERKLPDFGRYHFDVWLSDTAFAPPPRQPAR